MLPRGVLVDGSVGGLRITTVDLLGLPDKVLEQVAVVLGEDKELGGFNNISQITDELLAIGRQLLRGRGERL